MLDSISIDVTLYSLVNFYQYFRGTWFLHLQGSLTTSLSPEDVNHHSHLCENIRSHNFSVYYGVQCYYLANDSEAVSFF
jgi:hypothetical protein